MVSVEDTGKEPRAQRRGSDIQPNVHNQNTRHGMGLSICRSIIEAHEGRLWVTADKGRGAIFHFTVPVDPGSPS
jgi:signal transduction histidine kinase